MNCRELREQLPPLLDELEGRPVAAAAPLAAARAHLATCQECAREVARHRRAWKLLGAIDHGELAPSRERLERMADAVLAAAGDSPAPSAPLAPILTLRQRVARVLAAAAVVVAATLGARLVLDHAKPKAPPVVPTPGDATFPDDPEFAKNFDVIRDLSDVCEGGDELDVDDDVLVLRAIEGV
jgi:hypothetical protein